MKNVMVLPRTFQSPSCSKQEVCNKPNITWRWHLGCQILDFRLFESLKNAPSKTFCSLKLSLGSWSLQSSGELSWISTWYNNTNFNDSLFNPRHFSWFKNYKLLILKLFQNSLMPKQVLLRTWIYSSWWRWWPRATYATNFVTCS